MVPSMLYEFLEQNRREILLASAERTKSLAGVLGNSEQLKLGLPLFFEQLIEVLRANLGVSQPKAMIATAALHGEEFLRMGYTLSHVVHAYGAVCQAITQLATIKNAKISSEEFNILNGCLDVAIASAVSEFQFKSNLAAEEREVRNLGSLAHELRNAVSSATVAHELIKAGMVGVAGSTASVLEANLSRMRTLIDRSLSEVRMRADADVLIEKFPLSELVDQIAFTARADANKRSQTLIVDIDEKIELETDRQYLLSALANLIQNAIKYTKDDGKIWVKARSAGDRVVIEVEDQCGGIDTNKIDELFEPFVKVNANQNGLGLGLTIAQRAVHLNQGMITVHSKPNLGCTFVIDLPQRLTPGPSKRLAVSGIDSIQPDFRRRK